MMSDKLKLGDMGYFKDCTTVYEDHSPIYFGIVIEVGEAYRTDYSPLYSVMCADGMMRDFFDMERYKKEETDVEQW